MPGPDTADAYDLARHVDDLEPLEQMAAVILQRLPVGAEPLAHHVFQLVDGEADAGPGSVAG